MSFSFQQVSWMISASHVSGLASYLSWQAVEYEELTPITA